MTTKRIRLSRFKFKWTGLVFTLGCAISSAFLLFPGSVLVFAETPQENETAGLVHGVTPPPQEVDVRSLGPAPTVDQSVPPKMVPPHVRHPEELKLKKQLIKEGLIKPRTDVIEDTGDHGSSKPGKEKNP